MLNETKTTLKLNHSNNASLEMTFDSCAIHKIYIKIKKKTNTLNIKLVNNQIKLALQLQIPKREN